MLDLITFVKEVYAGKTAQICVSLLICQSEPLCEFTDANNYIFNSILQFMFIHIKFSLLSECDK